VFDGVEFRVLCRPVKFFHTDLDKPFLYGPHFELEGIVMLKQELPQTVATNLDQRIIQNVIVALRFPFNGSKGPNHEKQPHTIIPPPPNFTVGTMHWGS
jgi:hypothetical protein